MSTWSDSACGRQPTVAAESGVTAVAACLRAGEPKTACIVPKLDAGPVTRCFSGRAKMLIGLVDHACEESMMPDRGVEQGRRGVVGVVAACRLAVGRWGGRRSGYRQELMLGMIVLV
jgi:hypothetical protein